MNKEYQRYVRYCKINGIEWYGIEDFEKYKDWI